MKHINAPFTNEQVARLREWQRCPRVHPFTCCDHITMEVHRNGFVCPKCGLVQTWCHDAMLREIAGVSPEEQPPVCRHGTLRRKCETCDLEAEATRYRLALELIATCGGRRGLSDGDYGEEINCNGGWCAEQARRALDGKEGA